jgi:geranylgeranyl pyrophosphate synthase
VPKETTVSTYSFQGAPALEAARALIREDLELSWDRLTAQADDAPGELPDRLRWLSSRQGKRLRSTLLLLTTRLSDRPNLGAARLSAAAIELLHVASLAHDDVIDESDLRRGEASAPRRWGNQMAVLVGDYAFARSMKLAIGTGLPDIIEAINHASCQLAAGEVAELDLARTERPTWSGYREVIHLKTASLLEGCCRCGALSAGLPQSQVDGASRFGQRFGMAFQMCDDLLDLGGIPDLDKPVRTDLANGLANLPSLLRQELTGRSLADLVHHSTLELFGTLRDEGVLSRARDLIGDELREAAKELSGLPGFPARDHLAGLLAELEERSSRALSG